MGEVRQKCGSLGHEIAKIQSEIDAIQADNLNNAVFEKRADVLAAELKELQGILGDYNTFVDKLHTETDLQE